MTNNIIGFLLLHRTEIMFIIGFSIFFLFSLKNNDNFITIKELFNNHLAIFSNDKSQIILFYIMPLFLSLGCVFFKLVSSNLLSSIIIVLSILLTMLFTLIGTLINSKHNETKKMKKLLNETTTTILYESTMCIILLLICILLLFVDIWKPTALITTSSFFVYYLMIHIITNIFIIVQRINIIFSELLN